MGLVSVCGPFNCWLVQDGGFMIEKCDGGAAFPRVGERPGINTNPHEVAQSGMSLRDYFAAKVLTVAYADALRQGDITGFENGWRSAIAQEAYLMADAMLED